MLRDGRRVPDGAELLCDVCIVGAGPAGLALGTELARSAFRIVVLDSGGAREDPDSDTLSQLEFESADFRSPNEARQRQLGGMASRWDTAFPRGLGARLLRLDAIDFERREWVPNSGWPFGRSALEPYYERAGVLFGLDSTASESPRADWRRAEALPLAESVAVTTIDRLIPRERVTRVLRDGVASRLRTTVLHHATAVRVETDDLGSTVQMGRARSRSGTSFVVRAGAFVLAAGAVENARLLLLSNDVQPAGLGNARDNVGRFYMDHPYPVAGFLRPRDPALFDRMALYDVRERSGELRSGRLRIAEGAQRSERLLNGSVRLQPRLDERHRAALGAGRALVAAVRRGRLPKRPVREAATLLPVLPGLLRSGSRLGLRQRRLRPQPTKVGWSHLGDNGRRFGHFTLVLQPEQAPDPECRVTLANRNDQLGMRIPRLRWRWSELDLQSIRRTRELLADEFERSGIGVLHQGGEELTAEFEDAGLAAIQDGPAGEDVPLLMPEGAHHHLGTTRMHREPTEGVVDEHWRVHGVSNLFIAGGSVFPTGGSANPTFTIAALAIRLADHLRETLAAGARPGAGR